MDEKHVNQSGTVQRLQGKIDEDDEVVAFAQGWVSRDGRMNGLFAARTLDYCVLGRDSFYLFSTGFFSRRPRRRVFRAQLDRLIISVRKSGPPERLRLSLRGHRPLLIDFRRNARSQPFADALKAATRPPPQPAPPQRPPQMP
jgi:hypothetical protein